MDKTGANSLRLVWDKNINPKADLIKLIDNTIAHKMVAIPECHNATGKWGKHLQACVDFWNDPVLIEGIEGNRQWTILNIANEACDHSISDKSFLTASIHVDKKAQLITALAAGKANVTAATEDGGMMWSVDIEVK